MGTNFMSIITADFGSMLCCQASKSSFSSVPPVVRIDTWAYIASADVNLGFHILHGILFVIIVCTVARYAYRGLELDIQRTAYRHGVRH